MSLFIDFHAIQLVPPSNLNRDDTGSPKSARFGGVERHRVSSQAWKRAMRRDFHNVLDESQLGERTKHAASLIAEQLKQNRNELSDDDAMQAAQKALAAASITMDKKRPKETGALIFLAREEIAKLAQFAADILDGQTLKRSDVKKAIDSAQAVDVALFGRMLANLPELNVDASCQVKHALSVHQAIQEFDYFTAVDDLAPEDNAGAGMIGTVEFVSSTLYRYATINATKLVENIGSAQAASEAARAFTQVFTTSMPTGKQNTFANRTRPDFLLVEIRDDQPVELGNAFEDPIPNKGEASKLAAQRLVEYAIDGDAQYATKPVDSFYLAIDRVSSPELQEALDGRAVQLTLPDIVDRVAQSFANLEV